MRYLVSFNNKHSYSNEIGRNEGSSKKTIFKSFSIEEKEEAAYIQKKSP